jgi:hypothetical protein
MKIISASRRTDIPAFYGKWLMNRIHAGFAGYINPFNGKKYIVSLKKDDVSAIALWSKNFSPFINNAISLRNEGYPLFFNYTITGLPEIFEPCCPQKNESIESIKKISSSFSPDHINWRYDPVLITEITDIHYHTDKFTKLCADLSGFIKRCYISFPTIYGKVEKSFKHFTEKTSIKILFLSIQEKIELAEKLAVIAENYGIQIYSCRSDYLEGDKIKKGHCIDGEIISTISGRVISKLRPRPTRKECGCTESTDIGIYEICPHGCIYCYANSNFLKASAFYDKYRLNEEYCESAFLGVTKKVSDEWIIQISEETSGSEHKNLIQPDLFNY